MYRERALEQSGLIALRAPVDRLIFYPAAYLLYGIVGRLPVRPNHITLFHLALGLSTFWWLAQPGGANVPLAVGVFTLRTVLDALDGVVARAKGLTSQAGRSLDECSDGLSMVALVGGATVAAYREHPSVWWIVMGALVLGVAALMSLVYEVHRRRLKAAIEAGRDCIFDDYRAVRSRRSRSVAAWYGYAADTLKIFVAAPGRVSQLRAEAEAGIARTAAGRLRAEAQWLREGQRTSAHRRLVTVLSLGAGANLVALLLVVLSTGWTIPGLLFVAGYGMVMSVWMLVAMHRHLAARSVPSPETTVKPLTGTAE